MRTSTDCTSRAEECRRLAKLAVKPEDRQHFFEMATTWDMLAKQRPSDKLVEALALAEAIANGRNRVSPPASGVRPNALRQKIAPGALSKPTRLWIAAGPVA